MKRVRMLLRVSSNQQLEADGDLSVQRQLVKEYVEKQKDWKLDEKEYFEGSSSAYKNTVMDRDILKEALNDAAAREYDILVTYKDDRIGRRMWEIGAYVMTLKSNGVDIYTVKDGCISPENDDIMGQMVLALRYGSAQKSSSDTGMRVKDTAQKLVQKGRFMGGTAPYGYELVLSGEISKHGRALHKLQIIPERAKAVRYIFHLSLYREYGSAKIAKKLNEDAHYKLLAPNDTWKSATVTSILTNPIYAGYTAYKRREHRNGQYHRLDSVDWIRAEVPNEEIRIIDQDIWDKTQAKRKCRAAKFCQGAGRENVRIAGKKDGMLSLIDVIYCGHCGRKLTNGTKYSYWTIKATGERRACKIPLYRCPAMQEGMPHQGRGQFRADKIEAVVYDYIGRYLNRMQESTEMIQEIEACRNEEKEALENEMKRLSGELEKIVHGIALMQSRIPDAMSGAYPLRIEEIAAAIGRQRDKEMTYRRLLDEKTKLLAENDLRYGCREKVKETIPSFARLFQEADRHTQRVLVNTMIERIEVTGEQIVIRFKMQTGV